MQAEARQRKWSSKFLHSMSPIAGSAWFSKGVVSPPTRRRGRIADLTIGRFQTSGDYSQRPMIAAA